MSFFKQMSEKTLQSASTFFPVMNAGIAVFRYTLFSPFSNLPNNNLSTLFRVSQGLFLSSVDGGMSYLGATITSNRLYKLIKATGDSLPDAQNAYTEQDRRFDVKTLLKLYIAILFAISTFIYRRQGDEFALKSLGIDETLALCLSYITSLSSLYTDFGLGYLGGETFIAFLISNFGDKFSKLHGQLNPSVGVKVKTQEVSHEDDIGVELIFKTKIQ